MPSPPRKLVPLAALAACALLGPGSAAADAGAEAAEAEFHFARLAFGAYGSRYGVGRGEPWLRDWPEADYHFMQGVRRLTRIAAAPGSRQVGLDDAALFDYPVLYAVKVGFMRLSEREAATLGFNMDLGDAWEHADDAFYPEPLTTLAYRFGVNYLIYAMTH